MAFQYDPGSHHPHTGRRGTERSDTRGRCLVRLRLGLNSSSRGTLVFILWGIKIEPPKRSVGGRGWECTGVSER
ncbi:hypothetical protein XELAEV_18004397mg [Xenopus laevis]|uniref:Uncharacterized protein n=1 Tax=Xenopus laevis TaxID=8355 RepID=A0A974BMZ0_XENLA|nr:hypothetical protein XELAEV_18004397mg [Xenopus laevis]